MKVSTKDKKLLFIAAGLILFLVVYVYVFTPLQEKCDELDSQISYLENENSELENQYSNIGEYQEQIEVYRAAFQEDLKQFPADVKQEDIVVYLLSLQEANGVDVSSIAFTEPTELVSFSAPMEVDGTEQMVYLSGKQVGASVTTELSYEQLKDVLTYIYETQAQTTLESVSVSYNSEYDVLSGSFDFSKYALGYEGAVYESPAFPEVEFGQEGLFGN